MKPFCNLDRGLATGLAIVWLGAGLTFAAESVVPPDVAGSAATGAGMAAAPRISADGRWVVFSSEAGNLVPGDHNNSADVFLRDRQAGTTLLVSWRDSVGGSASGVSLAPDLTPDGRYVVFQSTAPDMVPEGLVPPTTNLWRSLIYRFDRETGEMRLINVNRPVPVPNPLLQSALTNTVRDLVFPQISPDGQRVLFATGRNRFGNPVAGQPGAPDGLFLWEASSGITEHLTERYRHDEGAIYSGQQIDNTPAMSGDGRYVALAGTAQQLRVEANDLWLYQMNVVVRDRMGGTNIVPNWLLDPGVMGSTSQPKSLVSGISDNWEYLLFERRRGVLVGEDSLPSQLWLLRLADGALHSVSTNAALGEPGNANSERGSLSADGNWIAYFSRASNLVAGDNNNLHDVFLHDRVSGTNLRISTHPAWQGVRGGRVEQAPRLTPDGRFILYQASGSGLFRYDRVTGTNALITADVATDTPDLSADGRFVVFTARPSAIDPADPNPHRQVYCHDFVTGLTELISVRDSAVPAATPNDASVLELAAVSATGRFIAFISRATNLGPSGSGQLWLRDTESGTNILVSVDRHGQPAGSAGGFQGVQISADGRWVSFMSDHPDLADGDVNGTVDVFLRDVVAGSTRLVSRSSSTYGRSFGAVLARDASVVVFRTHAVGMAATGGFWDLYGYSPAEATNRLVSLDITFGSGASGPCDRPVISPDGRWLLYRTTAYNVFPESSAGYEKLVLKDLTVQFGGYNGPVTRVSLDAQGAPLAGNAPGDWAFSADSDWLVFNHADASVSGVYRRRTTVGPSELVTTNGFQPLIANGGNIVAWQSRMPAAGYTDTNATWDVFHQRVAEGVTKVVSLDQSGTQTGNGASRLISLSPDGRYVLFRSHATNLVAGDANRSLDLFLRDTVSDTTVLLSRSFTGNISANGFSGKAVFTDDGTKIIFESYASDLVAGDFNLERDIFVAQLLLPDSDHDGLPDDWELTYFNTLDRDGTEDSDGDGLSDRDEFRAGTSPVNSSSILRAIAVTGVGSGTTTVLWSAVPGRTYQVQSRDTISEAGWANVGGPVTATGTGASVADAVPGDPDRFYRVVLVE